MLSINKGHKNIERVVFIPTHKKSLVCDNNADPGYFRPITDSQGRIWHPHFSFFLRWRLPMS